MSDHEARPKRESCEGKRRIPTWAEAKATARRLARQHERRVTPYHCQHCGRFHVGNDDIDHKASKLRPHAREGLHADADREPGAGPSSDAAGDA